MLRLERVPINVKHWENNLQLFPILGFFLLQGVMKQDHLQVKTVLLLLFLYILKATREIKLN